MAERIVVQAQARTETGKSAMRRLRKHGMTPAVIFGRSGDVTQISLGTRDLEKVTHSETGFNTIFTLKVDGEVSEKDKDVLVIIKEYQLEPVTHAFLHVSFYRVHMDRFVELKVPIITQGETRAVKEQGGIIDTVLREAEIRCLPADIPDAIHVDISELSIGDHVRVKELALPEGVEIMADEDVVVVHIAAPKRVVEAAAAAGEPTADELAEEKTED